MTAKLNYQAQQIPIDDVFVVGHRRSVNDEAVSALVESIKTIGLQTPITVRIENDVHDPESGEVFDAAYVLVTGQHRLAACRRLEWKDIPALVRDCDTIDAELWEIDENLCRSELTEAEEASHLKRRKELWEEIARRSSETGGKTFPTSLSDGRSAGPQHAKSFAAETACITGRSKRSINQKVERAEKIAPDVLDAITGSKWDKGVVLDILKRLDHDEQRQALQRVKSSTSASFQDAYDFISGEDKPKPMAKPSVIEIPDPKNWEDVESEQKRRLMQAWNACSPSVQAWFFETVREPVVMDQRYA